MFQHTVNMTKFKAYLRLKQKWEEGKTFQCLTQKQRQGPLLEHLPSSKTSPMVLWRRLLINLKFFVLRRWKGIKSLPTLELHNYNQNSFGHSKNKKSYSSIISEQQRSFFDCYTLYLPNINCSGIDHGVTRNIEKKCYLSSKSLH